MIPTPEPQTRESVFDDPRLADAMAEYLAALESGVRPNRQELLARYPEIAEELASCLEGLDFIHCVAPQLKEPQAPQGSSKSLATLGDFRIVREIGRGGMAVVYEAEQLSLGRFVALKVLPFAAMLDERQFKRFQNEARAVATLNHPQIVPIYGFGTDRGVHYYAMRLIDGQSLDHVLHYLQATQSKPAKPGQRDTATQSATSLSRIDANLPRAVASVGRQAAEALAHAHAQGILHRDIKPGNLLIDARGVLWVADFGLARMEHDLGLTRSGDVVGTLRYMSPEQLLGKPLVVDERSDIYSLGATLYELLTLRPVFDAHDRQQLLKQIGAEETPAPRQINKQVPPALSTIIHKCLRKDVAERYSSAQELAADLRAFLEDKPIKARPPTVLEDAARWLRRNRSLAWTAAAVLAVISSVLGVAIWQVSQERAALKQQRDLALEHKSALRRQLHAADMKSALSTLDTSSLAQVRSILDRHVPAADEDEVRGFAWHYLNHWCEQSTRARDESLVLRGHTGDVYSLALSPDGTLLASAGKDQTVRLWNAESGEHLRTFRGHTDEVNSVCFSPNSQTIATASDDRTVRVWDIATAKELWALPEFPRPAHRVRFSPDGKTLAVADLVQATSEFSTTFWDVESRVEAGRWDDRWILAFSPNGAKIATYFHALSSIQLGDAATLQKRPELREHSDTVPAGSFTPDGKLLVTGSSNSTLIIWDVEAEREVARFGVGESRLRTLAVSPDGKLVAIGGNSGSIWICNLASHSLYGKVDFGPATIWSTLFSANSEHVFLASADGTIRRCSMRLAAPHACLRASQSSFIQVALPANGTLLAAVDRGRQFHLWNISNSPQRKQSPIERTMSVFSWPRSDHFVICDDAGLVHFVEASSGRSVVIWKAHPKAVGFLALCENPRLLATANSDPGVVKLWDVDALLAGEVSRALRGEMSFDFVWSLCFSPRGDLLVATSSGLFRCDPASGTKQEIVTGHQNWVAFCDVSPDGRWFATASDKTIKLWDGNLEHEQATLLGHIGTVSDLAFAPDGSTLVSGSTTGELKLWDVATGQALFDLRGHSGGIHDLRFAPDGQLLVSAGASHEGNGEIWLWHAPRPLEKTKITGRPP